MSVKVIIFDFWGTLVENGVRPSPSKQVKYFLRDERSFSEFIATFEEAFMTRTYPTLREGFEAVTVAFDKRVPDFVYDKMVGMWNKFSILSRPFPDTLDTLEELKGDYKIVLLSNTDNFSIRQVMDKYDLEKHFDKVYLSCDTGLLKSNPASFQQVLTDFGIEASEALMVGDSPDSDLKGAAAANVPAVLIDRRDWAQGEDIPRITSLRELRAFIEEKP